MHITSTTASININIECAIGFTEEIILRNWWNYFLLWVGGHSNIQFAQCHVLIFCIVFNGSLWALFRKEKKEN